MNRFLKLMPYYMIKVDDNFDPIRDKQGFCVQCRPGEKGLIVGLIQNTTKGEFSGYANSNDATNKKIINNLFHKDQKAFNTGDVLVQDWNGYIYFVDRLGDTFRWKGENVSTLEVEDVISKRLNSIEVACYGVEIPGQEGKAGMIAIITDSDINLKDLEKDIKKDLPQYARPLFIRLTQSIEHTGSLKLIKKQLITDNFNINSYDDKTFYYDVKDQTYKILTKQIYNQILDQKFKI